MTEAEYGQVYALVQQSALNQFVVITTVMFAYVVSCHLAGKSLPRIVAILLSSIYCLFLVGPFIGYWAEFSRMSALSQAYFEEYPNGLAVAPPIGDSFLIGMSMPPMFLAWIGSVLYLHLHIRRDT